MVLVSAEDALALSSPGLITPELGGSQSSSCWFCSCFPLVHSVGHYLCHIMAAVINQGRASHTLVYLKLPGGGGESLKMPILILWVRMGSKNLHFY